ncbi:MAG: AEC family transporter [Propionibacteriaceae bacterium]|jgi:predicted permease|nr:AEC family transporter [Propionibacteriaceae bacterium]
MFIFILLGLFGAKKHWIGDQAISGMTNILVYFVTPAVIVQAFHRPFSWGEMRDLGFVAGLDFLLYPAMIGLTFLLFRRIQDPDLRRNLRYGGIYSNSGFMGIPLVSALLGTHGVFFAVLYLAMFNVYAWTHGWRMFAPDERGGVVKQLVTNPAIPAVFVGLAVFVSPVALPDFVVNGLGMISAMNAPLSMFVIGASLAAVRWRTFASDKWLWAGTGVRNVLIPLLGVLILWPIPLQYDAKLATLVLLACPVAAYLVMFSVMHKVSTDFPTRFVCLSTLVSILTLPATISLATTLWGG